MEKLTYYNENGNVMVSVRNQVRAQARDAVEAALVEAFGDRVSVNARGGFSIAVASTENDETIYYALEDTVTLTDPATERKTYAKKAKTVDAPDVPTLF